MPGGRERRCASAQPPILIGIWYDLTGAGSGRATIQLVDLTVQCEEVVEPADAEQPARQQVDDARDPFAEVEAVETEQSEKRQQEPGDGVVFPSGGEAPIRLAIHARDEE